MKSKIEKIEFRLVKDMDTKRDIQNIYQCLIELANKTNELIEAHNSQSQPEEGTQSAPMPEISSLPRKNGEYRYPEDYVGDPIGETTTTSSKDTPEEWGEKLWELIDEYRDSQDIASELEATEGVNQFVKQLLEEREDKARKEGVVDYYSVDELCAIEDAFHLALSNGVEWDDIGESARKKNWELIKLTTK